MSRPMREAGRRRLFDDLRAVVAGADALLTALAGEAAERAEAASEAVAAPEGSRGDPDEGHAVAAIEAELAARAEALAENAAQAIRDHPWRSLAAAAALGAVIGVLLGRR